MEIAVAVGSRGIDRITEITAEVVRYLKTLGAKPFVVPAMGSHGGAKWGSMSRGTSSHEY
ncbi:MAG: hypothetical protein QMC95_03005 [Desulfitobacteriaceae bacterium]|nr:hypothetical protein [Desulfitobacteriaceae bacterium]